MMFSRTHVHVYNVSGLFIAMYKYMQRSDTGVQCLLSSLSILYIERVVLSEILSLSIQLVELSILLWGSPASAS